MILPSLTVVLPHSVQLKALRKLALFSLCVRIEAIFKSSGIFVSVLCCSSNSVHLDVTFLSCGGENSDFTTAFGAQLAHRENGELSKRPQPHA